MESNNNDVISLIGMLKTGADFSSGEAAAALAKANPVAQAKIAQAYAQMSHNPNDPKVQRAYDALINETIQQFEDLQSKGLKITKIGENHPNPYKTSSDLISDVKKNNHMSYFPTETGYGAGDAASSAQDHPLLKATKHLDADGKPMLANDLFRVVHDYQGHVEGGNKFGATGEERAYQQHKKMFSPEAQKALTSETRGQNSWVNFGPNGEANRANPAATTYADQKAGLLPEWAMKDLDEVSDPIKYKLKGVAKAAGKYLGPSLMGLGAAMADSPEEAITDLVPGGVGFAGDPLEDRMIMEEIKARQNYEKSSAGKDATKARIPNILNKLARN